MLIKDKDEEYKALPCPFCNSIKLKVDSKANGYIDKNTGERHTYWRSVYDTRYGNFSVRCNKCHARGGVGHTVEEAVTIWNKRDWSVKAIEEVKVIAQKCDLTSVLPQNRGTYILNRLRGILFSEIEEDSDEEKV